MSGVPDDPGAEDLERMNRLTALVEAVAAETGVTLLDVDPAVGGYRYFLTAGAPTTVEDPEGRLLTAALRIVDGRQRLRLRAGVTSGRVFAGFVGAMYRQTYTVMGDPTNLAARLTARAEPGTVLVARSALERTSRPFETDDAGTITVKGKTQQIPVAVVTAHGGATDARGAADPVRRPAGRARAPARDARGRRRRGRRRACTLIGPAGIGKSRLVEHVLAETPLPVLRAHGDRYGCAQPLPHAAVAAAAAARHPADAPRRPRPAHSCATSARARASGSPALAAAPRAGGRARRPTPTPESDALDDAFRAERTADVLADSSSGSPPPRHASSSTTRSGSTRRRPRCSPR